MQRSITEICSGLGIHNCSQQARGTHVDSYFGVASVAYAVYQFHDGKGTLQPHSTAQEYGNCMTQSGKMVVFIEPTFQYCRNTEDVLNQLPFKHGLLGFEDITATNNTYSIQDYVQQLTRVRIVPLVFKESNTNVPEESPSVVRKIIAAVLQYSFPL
uniref:Uncharacterized protein n=1 Tax=Rattus norvegicus TaxID=10116 RepID=A0ABK0L0M4_RAT